MDGSRWIFWGTSYEYHEISRQNRGSFLLGSNALFAQPWRVKEHVRWVFGGCWQSPAGSFCGFVHRCPASMTGTRSNTLNVDDIIGTAQPLDARLLDFLS